MILAIEPDRHQANQLNTVVRSRLHADLVLGESAERALGALGDRVPDLILTSALLSPNDEVVLGERLRALDSIAAHVQTLTIPVLAGPRPRARFKSGGGVLSALRRGKSREAAPDGCDPAVFAAQCAEYLERAIIEHTVTAAAEDQLDPAADAPPAIVETAEPIPQAVPIREAANPIEERIVSRPLTVDAPAAAATVQEAIAQIEAMVRRQSAAASESVPDDFIEMDLSCLEDDAPAGDVTADDEPEVYEISASDAFDAEPPADRPPIAAAVTVPRGAVNDSEVWTPPRLGVSCLWPPIDGAFVESAVVEAREEAPRVTAARAPSKRGQKKQKPVQDEWGFFDPEQCGFAALLAKLDEIVDTDDHPTASRSGVGVESD